MLALWLTQPCTAPLNQEVSRVEHYWAFTSSPHLNMDFLEKQTNKLPCVFVCVCPADLSRVGSTSTILPEKGRIAAAESFVVLLKVQLFWLHDVASECKWRLKRLHFSLSGNTTSVNGWA